MAVLNQLQGGRAEQAHQARFARFVALILDSIFVSILSGIAASVYGVVEVHGYWNANGASYWTTQPTLPVVWTGAIWLAYYTVFEAMFSATPGKAMNRLRVVSVDDRLLSLRSIFLRNVLRLIDVLPGMYLIGGRMVMSSNHSQRLGDFAGHTTVVLREHAIEPGTARSSDRRAALALIAFVLAAIAFTVGFDYFGRPPMVMQTLYEEHQLMDSSVTSYSLGTPTWHWGRVVYPISGQEPGKSCTGHFELYWDGMWGWQPSGGQWNCFPA